LAAKARGESRERIVSPLLRYKNIVTISLKVHFKLRK